MSVLTEPPRSALRGFLRECDRAGTINTKLVYHTVQSMLAFEREAERHRMSASVAALGQRLEQRWYESLLSGEPDYGVYADDGYLAEAWYCWATYSRKYLRAIQARGGMPDGSRVIEHLGHVRRVADLGCGIAYSTAGLRSIFPLADIVGTNLGKTPQVMLGQRLAERHGFRVETRGLEHVGIVDLVFASEYFEHHREPVAHLRDVIRKLNPRVMLIANAFTNRSTGHFPSYRIDGEELPGRQASRRFDAELRAHGMVRVKTTMWNGRPAYWRRA